MIVKLLTEHHLECLILKVGCRGSSESTHVKMPHCWKSHALAHFEGVDDNGAGCAAVLEIARQLTSEGIKRQNTILFIGFDVEERSKCDFIYKI